MKYLLTVLPLLLVLSLFSCEPRDEVITTDSKAVLEFSGDTVLFDTVFVSQGSVTKRLKVFNPNQKAVRISGVTLAGAASSPYQLTINGIQSPLVNNIELRGNDSLYVLVKVNINPSDEPLPFLIADSILFSTNGQQQSVKLVAYGQNAYFHRKESIGNTTWANDKPHVLLDSVLVKENATLTIPEGTHIYAANKAVLLINGQLQVEGTPEKRVIFSSLRREPDYVTAPGQWEGIQILTKSAGNVLRYADIRNTQYGLRISNPGRAGTLVEGCVVANAFLAGIVGYTSDVKVVNTLIYNCGQYGFGGLGGGNYELLYSTIANYGNRLPRQGPALVVQGSGSTDILTSLRLVNSIIYSESYGFMDEVLLDVGLDATLEIKNNLLRTDLYKEQFSQNSNILNEEPIFIAPEKADFRLDTLSPASGAAHMLPGITTDIRGKARNTAKPDMGAYERTID